MEAAAPAKQPGHAAAVSSAIPTGGSVKPTLYGMRRSCDACGRRKRKCDGERPCRRCVTAGGECTYSKRRWHLPQPQRDHQRQPEHGGDSSILRQVPKSSTSGALSARGMMPLKRCRLSASPATGLVGLQENSFLSDFFGCVGFLPLTTQSHVRESMVKIMLASDSRHHSPFGDDHGDGWEVAGIAERDTFRQSLTGRDSPMNSSTCMFWCAVALGALVKGSPLQSVARYTQLAKEALANSYSGLADVKVAKALANVSYVYGFMGDKASSEGYLARADAVYIASIKQGLTDKIPVGFTELIMSREASYSAEMEALCAREQAPPQLHGAVSEPELYRYVMQAYHIFGQAVASTVAQNSLDRGTFDDAEPAGGGTGGLPDPQDLADAMVSVWGDIGFGSLEEIVDRSGVGAGVGGMIINSTLAFEAASTGDDSITLKRIGRCVDVLERYPGLCRSIKGCHTAHTMFAALAGLDASRALEVYDRLKAAYNSCRPHGSVPAPPLEEWRGISSICEDFQCRANERFMATEYMRAFSIPSNDARPKETDAGNRDKSSDPRGRFAGGIVSARIGADEEVFFSAPLSTESNEGRPHPSASGTCETLRDSSESDHAGHERRVEPAASPTASAPSATSPVHPSSCRSATELNGEHVAHGGNVCEYGVGGVATPPETFLMEPAVLGEGVVEELEDSDIGASDWLDVTHSLLDEVG